MWKLIIETSGDKHDNTREEMFSNVDDAVDRKAFLKSIEKRGSSNTYRLVSA